MILTNARVIFPGDIREGWEVVCEDGRIAEVRARRAVPAGEVIDLEGNFLAPGFIDLHLHGAAGRDTMEATPDAFRAICDYHASGGTTGLLLTTATAPLEEIVRVLRAVEECRPQFPQILGVHVEGPFLSPERPGAQRVDCLMNPEPAAVAELLQFSRVIRRITLAPELPGAPEAIARFRAAGIAVSGGHSNAWEEEARCAFASGMRHTTHTFNCMSSLRRRDGERVAGLLEFALSEPEIVCELIADGRHVSPTLMKMLYRAKGRAGICLVTDATAGAGLAEGMRFQLAGRDCRLTNGACWLADGSALAGSAARMIDLIRVLVREAGVPLAEAIGMATTNPARTLDPEATDLLRAGRPADFVVLSPALEVVATYRLGERVFPQRAARWAETARRA